MTMMIRPNVRPTPMCPTPPPVSASITTAPVPAKTRAKVPIASATSVRTGLLCIDVYLYLGPNEKSRSDGVSGLPCWRETNLRPDRDTQPAAEAGGTGRIEGIEGPDALA